MDIHDAIPHVAGEGKAGGGGTTPLFLGLFLLILAFFILLVSISTLEKVKSKAVMDSLSSTFSTVLPPSAALSAFTAKEGEVDAGELFQKEITEIISATIEVAKIEIVHPGRLMRIRVPSDSIFFSETDKIREAQYPLLDRIVATLSSRPPDIRYDMEFVIGSKYVAGQSLPIGQTLEMSRVGVFARALMDRGVPQDSISVGMAPGDPAQVKIWFYVRSVNETKLKFTEENFDRAMRGERQPKKQKTAPPAEREPGASGGAAVSVPLPAPAK